MNELIYISGCSGAGGGDIGLKATGKFRCVCYIEIIPYRQAILIERMQEGLLDSAPIYNNFKSFDGKPWRGRVHMFFAGIPCQPHSMAGKRRGKEDDRNLWPSEKRIIGEMEPSIVVVENVPGIFIGERPYGLTIIGELQAMGYCVCTFTLSAKQVGALHLRERRFIVGFKLADNSSIRYMDKLSQKLPGKGRQPSFDEHCPSPLTNDGSRRIQRNEQEKISRLESFSWCEDVRRIEDLRNRSDIPEPLIRGKGNGIPHRVDRIEALGDAIVPQVAYQVGEIVYEIATKT